MVNRPAGGDRSKQWERADYDWYRESPRVVSQLLNSVDFSGDLIWDPCCGAGNVLDVAKLWGYKTFGSDIKNRHPRHDFQRGDILRSKIQVPLIAGRGLSVISNTPYSYEDDIAERIMMHLLDYYPIRRAAFIVPVAFFNSQNRWNRILERHHPSHVCFYRERHSMPPGHLIESMSNPYGGGMADYGVVVFTRPYKPPTQALWLEPGEHIPRQSRRG